MMDHSTHAQIKRLGPSLGEMGSVCIEDTSILDIVLKQEVSNKTLSYIPLKVSAVSGRWNRRWVEKSCRSKTDQP